jgi:hypothetical protein
VQGYKVANLAKRKNERHSPNHLVYFFISELLAQVGHDVTQLSRRDKAVAVLVEDSERFANLLLAICVFHFARHHRKKLGKVYGAVAYMMPRAINREN